MLCSLSPFVFSLPDTLIHCHCSSPKPHLSGLLSDRRRSSNNAQLLTNQLQAETTASTRRGRLPSADQSRDWFIRSSTNHRDTMAPAFLSSTTVLEVLGRPDLHQGKTRTSSGEELYAARPKLLGSPSPRHEKVAGYLGCPPYTPSKLTLARKWVIPPQTIQTISKREIVKTHFYSDLFYHNPRVP